MCAQHVACDILFTYLFYLASLLCSMRDRALHIVYFAELRLCSSRGRRHQHLVTPLASVAASTCQFNLPAGSVDIPGFPTVAHCEGLRSPSARTHKETITPPQRQEQQEVRDDWCSTGTHAWGAIGVPYRTVCTPRRVSLRGGGGGVL